MELLRGYFDFYIISPTVVVLISPPPRLVQRQGGKWQAQCSRGGRGAAAGDPPRPLRAPALGGMRVSQPPAPSLNFQPLHFQRTGEKINK